MSELEERHTSSLTGLEIAVIGMSGRFPGAANLDEFWENLKNGVESICFFSDKELEDAGVEPELLNNSGYVKTGGGFLEDSEFFAASFFDYTPNEAIVMHPQVRIFHECALAALESAAYNPDLYEGKIGIYAGASSSFKWESLIMLSGKADELGRFAAANLANRDSLSTRVSYRLNLKGPAFVVQAACSTSLVAVDLACRGIWTGQCDMALAGGVSISVAGRKGYLYKEGMTRSPDGHCRAFDERAKGTISGEGIGVVVLKLLENALADGDTIHAVIKGSAANNDGSRKVGYTAPSIEGQAEVIRAAHLMAEIEPVSITYVETQGTGTPLGDPVEIEALKQGFGTDKKGFCRVGSVKTNVGHLDAAAGAAAFIKTVLALTHRQVPPSLHYERPNPAVDFKNSPFYVNTKLMEWKNETYPLRAGINSFGIGGTNAHIVLEEGPNDTSSNNERIAKRAKHGEIPSYGGVPRSGGVGLSSTHQLSNLSTPQLIVLSAKTQTALDNLTKNLAEYFRKNPGTNLPDAAFTLQVGRGTYSYKRMALCAGVSGAVKVLTGTGANKPETFYSDEKDPAVIFMFPGQDSRYVDVGRGLYEKEPVFKREVDRCCEILKPLLNCDLKTILYPSPRLNMSDSSYKSYINRSKIARPLLFTIAYALTKLLLKWGIKPHVLLGHGSGKDVAAHLSADSSLADALRATCSASLPAESDEDFKRHLNDKGIKELLKKKNCIFVAVGPGEKLTALVKGQIAGDREHPVLNLIGHPEEEYPDDYFLYRAIGRMWLYGQKIDWRAFHEKEPAQRRRIPLPTYPFERRRYWIEESALILNRDTLPGNFLSGDRKLKTSSPQEKITALHPRPQLPEPYEAPSDKVQQSIAEIWQRVFGYEKIGIKDDFFQLGGDSLKAVTLISAIHKQLQIEITLPVFFNNPTVEKLAEYVVNTGSGSYSAIPAAEKKEHYPLTSAQQRFFFMQQLAPETTFLNMPDFIALDEKIDVTQLEQTLRALINRHESLRTSFQIVAGEVVQRIHNPGEIDFKIESFQHLASGGQLFEKSWTKTSFKPQTKKTGKSIVGARRAVPSKPATRNSHPVTSTIENFIRPFDLSRAPLLRAGLMTLPDGKYIFMVDLHHIINDGFSRQVLARDFAALLSGEKLPRLRLQYRDFTRRQVLMLRSGQGKRDEEYWLNRFSGRLPELYMPTDFPRPRERNYMGERFTVTIDRELSRQVKELAVENGASLFMVMLTALNILLYRYTGQEDIIIGTVTAGRNHADLENIIGLLLGTLLLRNFPAGEKSFIDFLQEVKNNALEAYKHQFYPFEELLKALDYEEDLSGNPVTGISLIGHHATTSVRKEEPRQKPTPVDSPPAVESKMDLTINVLEQGEHVALALEYRTALFRRSTMERLVKHLEKILREAVKNNRVLLSRIDMLSSEEKLAVIGRDLPCYPLTHAQKRIYYTDKRYPGTPVNTVAFTLKYEKILDKELLQQAINLVIERNEGLRLRIVEFDLFGEPLQYAVPYEEVSLDEVDFSSSGSKEQAVQWFAGQTQKPFDLINKRLFYFVYIKFNEKESGYYAKLHHSVTDGWSAVLLFKQVDETYEALAAAQAPDLTPCPSYLKYISEEEEYLISQQLREDREFWLSQMLPLPEDIQLGSGRDEGSDIASRLKVLPLPEDLRQKIHNYCKDNKTTIYKLVLSALSIYIWRAAGTADVVIATASHNRSSDNLKKTAGMFVSTIPLRIKIDDQAAFARFTSTTGEKVNFVLKNYQRYPFDRLALEIKEKTGSDPAYLLNINLIGHPGIAEEKYRKQYHFPGFDYSTLTIHINTNNRDIHGILELDWNYRYPHFSPDDIDRMHNTLVNILNNALADPDRKLRDIELLSSAEKEQILYTFNADDPRAAAAFSGKTLHRLFDRQAEQTPCAAALTSRDRQVTYCCLRERSERLTAEIKAAGKQPIIGVLLDPGDHMITGLLGILKAGSAYLPIDPRYPRERIEHIIWDSHISLMLTGKKYLDLSNCATNIMMDAAGTYSGPVPAPVDAAVPGDPAYVIYTSGSTGTPKGVVITHRNAAAYIEAFQRRFNFQPGDIVIQQASCAFDAFVEEMYPILLNGGRLTIPTRDEVVDIEKLTDFIARQQVTRITCSPLMLDQLNNRLRSGTSIKTFISGGDRLKYLHIGHLMELGDVYNTYGPTETTVCVSYHKCLPPNTGEKVSNIPIGKPIYGYSVFILDKCFQPLPIGINGELCVAGPGVGAGYLNNPELTAEKFVKAQAASFKPQAKAIGNPVVGARRAVPSEIPSPGGVAEGRGGLAFLYKTGDLCRWLPDGSIEFSGRIDDQVKIRGYRIELGEIENRLTRHPGVKEVVVLARQDNNNDEYLVAYFVPPPAVGDEKKPAAKELKEFLSQTLPDYMVPSYFVQVDRIPLTNSGKLDKKALPLVDPGSQAGGNYRAPENQIEEKLAGIWSEILGIKKEFIGIDDDFFDLGGHSLKATILAAKVHKEFNVRLPLSEIFKVPFISGIADFLKRSETKDFDKPEKTEEKEYYESSFNQKRLWFIQQMNPQSAAFNMPGIIGLEHNVDGKIVAKALCKITGRFESFRTAFKSINDQPVQVIEKKVKIPFKEFDLSSLALELKESKRKEILENLKNTPFDLSRAPLLRAVLIKLADDYFELGFNIHHIITDGWSMETLRKDFYFYYDGYRQGKEVELQPLPLQYKDFSTWHNSQLKNPGFKERSFQFWQQRLQYGVPELELPLRKSGNKENLRGASYRCMINRDITRRLKSLAERHHTSLFTVMFSVYLIALSRFSSQKTGEVVCSVISAGREHSSLFNIVGFFVNSVLFQTRLDNEEVFQDFLNRVHLEVMEIFQHQNYPLELVFENLKMKYPDIPVSFNMLNLLQFVPEQEIEHFAPYHTDDSREVKFDIEPYIREVKNGIVIDWLYKGAMFTPAVIECFVAYYNNLLDFFSLNPHRDYRFFRRSNQEIKNRERIPAQHLAESENMISIARQFEDQVARTPDNVAVKAAGGNITYAELNRYANTIANRIAKQLPEKSRQETVGLFFEHGYHMIAAILGVLKAGQIYVPLSADYPENRLAYILSNSGACLILSNDSNENLAKKLAQQTNIDLLNVNQIEETAAAENPGDRINRDKPAYILYTSGSTGRPKGVMQTNSNVLYYTQNWTRRFAITAADRLTLFSSFLHDGSVQDMFAALLNGAMLFPLDMKYRENTGEISEFLIRERITIWHSVPSLYTYFANTLSGEEEFKKLRFILLGGEPVREHEIDLLKKFFPYSTLANVYGQTESSVSTICLIGQEDSIDHLNLGEPLSGHEIFVVDEEGNEVETLEKGEIVVASPYISPGYWKDDAKTGASFATHAGWGKIYRTGDLGRLLPAGEIEFMGRRDAQIKIRGFRIEPGEIENQLLKHPVVKEAIITAGEDKTGDRYLSAYIIPRSTGSINPTILREFLSLELPDYMIPSYFVQLEKFPLTQSGKIDRRALPIPQIEREEGYTGPRNSLEEKLVETWAEILALEKEVIGIDSNFFELGGHSLKAAALVSKLHKKIAVKIALPQVFKTPTIRGLSGYIKGMREEKYTLIEQSEKRDYYPATAAQQRFFFMQHLAPETIVYNMPYFFSLDKDLTGEQLEQTFRKLIDRHESLRTSFHIVDGQLVQRIHQPEAIEFRIENFRLLASGEQGGAFRENCPPAPPAKASVKQQAKETGNPVVGAQRAVPSVFIHPFDLSRAPLLRAGILKGDQGENIFMVDLHHIISDGSSRQVLTRDFSALLSGEKPAPPRLQYRDFARWQTHMLRSSQGKQDEEYWLNRFSGELPTLQMPTDFLRPREKTYAGDRFTVTIDRELTRQVKELAVKNSASLFMVMLTALYVLLYRYTGQEDIIIGTVTAGRYHADLENTIGLLLGTLLLRNFPAGEKSFIDFLQEVKESTLEAYSHQYYPFEELLKALDYEEDLSGNPITGIALIGQNVPAAANKGKPRQKTAPVDSPYPAESKLDLTINMLEKQDRLILALEYRTTLFRRSTMERLVKHLEKILREAVNNNQVLLSRIDMVSSEEKLAVIGSDLPCYPLTHAQKRIYYTDKKYPGIPFNTVVFILKYNKILDKEILRQAVNLVIKRNEGLRLRIVEFASHSEPLQYAAPCEEFSLAEVDPGISGNKKRLDRWIREDMREPIDLINNRLFSFAYLKFNDKESGYYAKLHHIITDGWSVVLLFNQINETYESLTAGQAPVDTPYPSYLQYISKEAEYLKSPQSRQDREFWLGYTLPLPEEIDLGSRGWQDASAAGGIESRIVKRSLPGNLRDRIHRYCEEHNISLYKLFLSAFSIYLWRVTGAEDIVIAAANHNRSSESQKTTAGIFVGTLPLRIKIDRQADFISFAAKTKEHTDYILKNHQRYPFDRLALEIKEKTGTHPGYLLNINLVGHPDFKEDDYKKEYRFPGFDFTPLTIHINVNNMNIHGILELDCYYRHPHFSRDGIERMLNTLLNILNDVLAHPGRKLRDIDLLSPEEKEQILYAFNAAEPTGTGTAGIYSGNTLHRLFDRQAEQTPRATALVFRDRQVTYSCLQERSERLALGIKAAGKQPIVGVLLDPAEHLVTGLLGILKAGSAYLPIDPRSPVERINYIIQGSHISLMLTEQKYLDVSACPANIIVDDAAAFTGPAEFQPDTAVPDDPAYVIYTSGSTGRPKGVIITHRSAAAYIEAFQRRFNFQPKDIVIQQASCAFDTFVEEMYPILLNGGRLVIPGRDEVLDIEKLTAFIARQHVTRITCSPQLLGQLNNRLHAGTSIKTFISGGDRLKYEHIDHLLELGEVYNTYGPTETTVCVSYYKCLPHSSGDTIYNIPIGKPIYGYLVYILDKCLKPLPIGINGELCVAGPGVSAGYLNNPELTAEKFLTAQAASFKPQAKAIGNPVVGARRAVPSEILYKTGDLCRWLPDGSIEFSGRIDDQVKIRGYRIELGEIENCLVRHRQIKEAVVLGQDINHDEYLVAYFVPQPTAGEQQTPGAKELKEFLSHSLPDYMIPSYFVRIDAMPLTSSGKVNKKLLPKFEPGLDPGASYTAPRNPVEEKLVVIWSEILGVKHDLIGIDANFFDLGGHSLKATALTAKIQREFNVTVSLADVFRGPTIRQLAPYAGAKVTASPPGKDENLALLRNGKNKRDVLFFIHDGSGEVEGYIEFCNYLNSAYNCWGIRADRFENYAPKNLTIEDIALEYIKQMKLVQPAAPYRVCGWSLGGTIAFEMVRLLEQENKKIDFFAMIDVIPPRKNEDLSRTKTRAAVKFTPAFELNWIKEYLPGDIYEKIKNITGIAQMWDLIAHHLETNPSAADRIEELIALYAGPVIPAYARSGITESIKYLNIVRSFWAARVLYIPAGKINTPVHYFRASRSRKIKYEKWNRYSLQPLKCHEVSGDHYSIFKAPGVIDFAAAFDRLIPPYKGTK